MRASQSLLVALVAWSAACHHAPAAEEAESTAAPVHVTCVAVQSAPIADARTLRGTVVPQPDHDAIVAPQVAGRVLRVVVREADLVHAGDVVAEVESQPARDALAQARALLQQVQAQVTNARITRERSQHLFDRGIAARQEVDDATAREREALAGLGGAQAAVNVAARNVSRAEVRAPIDGTVVRVIRRAGELVDGTPSPPVLEIADATALEFQASATAADLMALRPGLAAEIHFDAAGDAAFVATVRTIAPSIDATTGLGQVRLTMSAADRHPPLGVFGVATVRTGEHAGLRVPARAVRGAGASAEVLRCDGEHARVTPVEIGARDGDTVEIVRGLEASQRVVTGDAVVGLADGVAIVSE